jgi:lipoate-protein ligase A
MHDRGKIPDTLRFHRYPPCVLLGRSQHPERAADVGYCARAGIDLARRVTGGGAVYMSPGMLAWDVVIDRKGLGGSLGLAAQQLCEGIAEGLCLLGCRARFRPPNDIEIGGRKVSGSSGYAEGRSIALQGTVLIGDEAAEMARALRSPEALLRERTTCLSEAVGELPSLERIQAAIGQGLSARIGRVPFRDEASMDDLAAAEAMLNDLLSAAEDAT